MTAAATRLPPNSCSSPRNLRPVLSQIDAASNRIAHYLRNAALVVPGDVVAILMLRGPVMIAALLGVLKAGAGYLPLDHHHPEERTRFVLSDAGVKVCGAPPTSQHTLTLAHTACM
jgi:non-ribosomal peptide synthetase component F